MTTPDPRPCTVCKKTFPPTPEFFHRNKAEPTGLARACKSCARAAVRKWSHENYETKIQPQLAERARKWRETNKGRDGELRRTRHKRYRVACLQHYSEGNMCCNCCGESIYEFLSIDHIGGGGHQHRKDVGQGITFLRWLINSDFPKGFQVLCHNCNMARAFYGECPHKQASATSK